MDSTFNSFDRNKHLKEQFVSNLTGSSMLEIAALSTVVPLLFLLRHAFCHGHGAGTSVKKDDNADLASRSWRSYVITITVDFVFIVLPMLFIFTILAEWTYILTILVVVLILSLAAKSFVSSTQSGGSISVRANLSSYRISVMIVTCLCILAVDFHIFPRRYAKAETYGTSLMDLGVGSFVLANSLVSRQARNISSVKLKSAIQSSSPLLLLGFIRLVSTRSVDYQVHVGEYGVHWNFFFTLAAVSILSAIIHVPPQYSGILGLIILVGYQWWLSQGLNVYLLSDKRDADIISQNKEGIFSILGYWGLYLIGVRLGFYLFFGNYSSTSSSNNKWARLRIFVLSLIFWVITILMDRHVERVSRRTCNLPYVTLVLAQNLQVLALLMLSDFIPGSKISALEEAFNQNLLGTFLLANVLTGLVNMYTDTLSSSSFSALIILVAYAYILSIVTGILVFCGVRLKFW